MSKNLYHEAKEKIEKQAESFKITDSSQIREMIADCGTAVPAATFFPTLRVTVSIRTLPYLPPGSASGGIVIVTGILALSLC